MTPIPILGLIYLALSLVAIHAAWVSPVVRGWD